MAKANEITPEQAIGNILCGISFNASGFISSLANAFIILDNLPVKGKALLQDEELLESIAWELLRHNGPGVSLDTEEDTTICTSEGIKHRVKKGTKLYTHLGYVQRDATVWANPDTFKADRFKPLPARTEAKKEVLPTVGFGCPLGRVDDEHQRTNCHQCIFTQLAQPYVFEYLKLLLNEFKWEIQGLELKMGSSEFEFDFSPSQLLGGLSATTFIPKAAKTCTVK